MKWFKINVTMSATSENTLIQRHRIKFDYPTPALAIPGMQLLATDQNQQHKHAVTTRALPTFDYI